jgi:acetyl esterase
MTHDSGGFDPEIKVVLDGMLAAGGPPAHEVPVDQAREGHERETALFSGPGEAVAEVTDISVPGPGGDVPARVYRPDRDGPLPVIAYFHGGGWVVGSIDSFDSVCRALANASGAIVVNVGYRLAPEHPFPAALEDCVAVTRWLAGEAGKLGGDPARLAVAGDSAGGGLAIGVARHLRDAVRFQALIYPVCDAGRDTPSYSEFAEGHGLTAKGMERFWTLYLDGADGNNPDASPLRATDLEGLAPAFVLTAQFDVLRDEGEAMAEALRAAGVEVTYRRYDGTIHGFWRWLAKARITHDAIAEVGSELRSQLR